MEIDHKRIGQVLAPSLFTLGNMACGFYALLASHRGEFTAAATAIILGGVFDGLDGRVARLVHGESTFGVEFDSLSDFLTFGVAPAHMMYGFILKDYGPWGFPLAFLFAMCGSLRLARFNAVAHETGGSKTHFTGLPIPAGAAFLASFVMLYQIVEEGKPAHTVKFLMDRVPGLYGLAPLMVVALSLLMVSTIPFTAFKSGTLWEPAVDPNGTGQKPSRLIPTSVKKLLAFCAAGLLFVTYPQTFLFLAAFLYAISGPIFWLIGRLRSLLGLEPRTPQKAPSHPS